MKTTINFKKVFIEFEPKDWNNGIAREIITQLKTNKARYNPTTKQWSISQEGWTRIKINRPQLVTDDGFDIDDWLDQFGE